MGFPLVQKWKISGTLQRTHKETTTFFQYTVRGVHVLHKWAGGGAPSQTMMLQEMCVDGQDSTEPGRSNDDRIFVIIRGSLVTKKLFLVFKQTAWQLRSIWNKFSHGRDNFQKLILTQIPSLTRCRSWSTNSRTRPLSKISWTSTQWWDVPREELGKQQKYGVCLCVMFVHVYMYAYTWDRERNYCFLYVLFIYPRRSLYKGHVFSLNLSLLSTILWNYRTSILLIESTVCSGVRFLLLSEN